MRAKNLGGGSGMHRAFLLDRVSAQIFFTSRVLLKGLHPAFVDNARNRRLPFARTNVARYSIRIGHPCQRRIVVRIGQIGQRQIIIARSVWYSRLSIAIN